VTFERAVAFVLDMEGEDSNLAGDAGGVTRFGISKRAYPQLDIPNLTQAQAIAIYRRDYWDKLRCGELPNGLDLLLFDAAVNEGPSTAARMLQNVLKMVPQDGIIGSETLRAARESTSIVTDYLAKRMYRYALIPQLLTFGSGWYRRLAKAAQLAFQS